MRSRFIAVVAALLVTLSLAARVSAQQQFQIYVNVVDGTGAPVASLQPGDLRVTENGATVTILKVEPVNWPTKLQLLVDNGVGLGPNNITSLRNGIRSLLDVLPPEVEVTLVTTAPQPRFLVRGTADRDAIMKGFALLTTDSGAGRFVESLNEATQRIEKDKGDYFPIIVSLGTTSGDRNVMERDIERIMQRLEQRPTTVHVVLYSSGTQSSTGGQAQTNVGLAVTKYTRGRFENINSATRLETLLPEIGVLVAKSHEGQSHQFRVTAQRAAGASGPPSKVGVGARAGLTAANVSFDGRIP